MYPVDSHDHGRFAGIDRDLSAVRRIMDLALDVTALDRGQRAPERVDAAQQLLAPSSMSLVSFST